jgi:hypothetical protein
MKKVNCIFLIGLGFLLIWGIHLLWDEYYAYRIENLTKDGNCVVDQINEYKQQTGQYPRETDFPLPSMYIPNVDLMHYHTNPSRSEFSFILVRGRVGITYLSQDQRDGQRIWYSDKGSSD